MTANNRNEAKRGAAARENSNPAGTPTGPAQNTLIHFEWKRLVGFLVIATVLVTAVVLAAGRL